MITVSTSFLRDFWTARRISYLVLCVCLAALVVLHLTFVRANGPTVDEFTHLQAGYRYWNCGEFANNPEHPPLTKWLAAFPIRRWQIGEYPFACGSAAMALPHNASTAYALSTSAYAAEMLWKARVAEMVFAVILLLSVFFATRTWFGDSAAAIAAVLITFEPNVVAHTSLVTSDGAFTAFSFVVLWLTIEFVRGGSRWALGGAATALGLAFASKHSAVILPVLISVVLLIGHRLTPQPMSWRRLLAAFVVMCSVGVAILWSSYGFRFQALPHTNAPTYDVASWFRGAGMEESLPCRAIMSLLRYQVLPEAYLAGLADVFLSSARFTYFFGQVYSTGIWYYFPVALAIKVPTGILLLSFASICAPGIWRKHTVVSATLCAGIAVLLGFAMIGKINIGVRHVLPVVPIVVVLSAAGATAFLHKGRAVRVLTGTAIVWSVVSAVHCAPFQISYANEAFGGPTRLHRYLSDSNLDWGQSKEELRKIVSSAEFVHSPCAVAPGMVLDAGSPCMHLPTFFDGVVYNRMDPILPDTFEGTIVLQPLVTAWTDAYVPLLNHIPDKVAGHGTILIYRGRFDFRAVAALRRFHRGAYLMYIAGKSWPSDAAVQAARQASTEFAAAEQYCPEMNRVELEFDYVMSLTAQQRWEEARYHAYRLLQITADVPTYRQQRQLVLRALSGNLR